MNKDEQTFGTPQLNSLKSIADELEHHTCKHIIRYIFQESMEIERYPQAFRERFDIAFSQAVITMNKYIDLFNLEDYFSFHKLSMLLCCFFSYFYS